MNRETDQDLVTMTRRTIFSLINLISDKKQQKKYEKENPKVSVNLELMCMWFHDNYPVGKQWFKECFSFEEQRLITEFSNYYEERLNKLPEKDILKIYLRNKSWKEIMKKAQDTVKLLNIEDYKSFQ
ncbi:MAG: hypothetical protein ABFS17_01745 [Chloroflexota bacterium]